MVVLTMSDELGAILQYSLMDKWIYSDRGSLKAARIRILLYAYAILR